MSEPKSFFRLWLRGWGWVSAVAAATALVFLLLWYFPSRLAAGLDANGFETIAEVTDLRIVRNTETSDHEVRYRFTTVDGQVLNSSKDVAPGLFKRLQRGQQIPVRYLPDNPVVSEIEFGANDTLALIGLIGVVASLSIATFAGRKAWVRASQFQWLRQQAVQRRVKVLDHVQTNVRINDIMQWRATWREDNGREGQTRMAPPRRLPQIGEEITIYIDPHGKLDSVWTKDV